MATKAYLKGELREIPPRAIVVRLRSAARAGNSQAQHLLGVMYVCGHGLKRSVVRAAHWMQKAADQGYPQAQSDLAALQAAGRGVPPNLQQARFWLRKAADQGFIAAASDLERLQR